MKNLKKLNRNEMKAISGNGLFDNIGGLVGGLGGIVDGVGSGVGSTVGGLLIGAGGIVHNVLCDAQNALNPTLPITLFNCK